MTAMERTRDFLRAVALGDAALATRPLNVAGYLDHDPAVVQGGVEGLQTMKRRGSLALTHFWWNAALC